MAAGPVSERNQDATIYVGGLDEKVTHGHVLAFLSPDFLCGNHARCGVLHLVPSGIVERVHTVAKWVRIWGPSFPFSVLGFAI